MAEGQVLSARAIRDHVAGDEPLRAELLSSERLGDEARGIAVTQHWTTESPPRTTPLIELMSRAAQSLEADNRELAQSALAGFAASPAAEWLLDNYYLIEEQVLLVKRDLPAHYGVELPRLEGGALEGFPRIYEALLTLVAHTDSRFDASLLVTFVEGYQDIAALNIGEVWAVPIMLRIAVVENLRRLSAVVVRNQRSEQHADAWASKLVIAAQDAPESLGSLLSQLAIDSADADHAFFLRLAQRLSPIDTGGEAINSWLERRLAAQGLALHEAQVQLQTQQAANQVSIANSITSIRFLDAYEWREFFEEVSLVEQVLYHDPAQTYAVMDFDSRDRYRHALELMARRCSYSEVRLAEEVVSFARAALVVDPADDVKGHVGWWIIGDGRFELEKAVGYTPTIRERFYRGPLRRPGVFYWGTLFVLAAGLELGLALYAASQGAPPISILLLALLGLIPLSEVALSVVNRLSSFVFPPRVMSKLDHRRPVAEAHRTFVVIPALLTSTDATRHVIENMEIAYLANRDRNIAFGLLGDLRAADTVTRPEDGPIIESAVRGISELNARYEAEHGVRPFHVLLRARRQNPADGVWMGWERKRGSLIELVREMRGERDTSFETKLGDVDFRHSSTFVITLDTDTILTRDAARKLICAIAHPLNRAQLEPGASRVRTGYGLVQPRVGMSLSGARRSRFASLYSGVTGIDPYAGAISDTYQDVFGEGSFTGKGIFEVDIFRTLLDGRFPDNTLLSHDLVEGSFLRTALASDVEVLDDYPANYLAAASRLHRWIRGDWQTLPFLGPAIERADGSIELNPLNLISRWKIFDNLRRALVPPATLLLFTVGWWLFDSPALSWPLALLLVVLFPAYFSLADSMVFRPRAVSFGSYAPDIVRDFAGDTKRGLLSLAVLPYQAWTNTDASVRAVWRRFVTRAHLLEWETAADAEKRAGTTPSAFWRTMGIPVAIALSVLAVVSASSPRRLVFAVPLALLWLAGPFIAWWLSEPLPPRGQIELSDTEVLGLRRIARKTWRFFETFVVADGHHLAPDNFQEEPGGVVAWRTSPTNMGLQLLAGLGAYDLGYLTLTGLVDKTSQVLATLAGMERYRGHFYNWYDTRTLSPLRPAYVSTVDSGNLAGHLLVLRIGLLEASEAPIIGPQILDGARDSVRLALEDLVAEQEHLGAPEAVGRARATLDALERSLALAERPHELGSWAALLDRLQRLTHEAEGAINELEELDPDDATESVSEEEAEEYPFVAATPLERLHSSVGDAVGAIDEAVGLLETLAPWASLIAQARLAGVEHALLAPVLSFVPSLTGLAEGLSDVIAALEELGADKNPETAAWARKLAPLMTEARPAAVQLLAQLRLDTDIAREMWEHTDFRMLYDPHRQLFSIGYNMAEARLDPSFYDLMASECRLASFLAIAKGDVPQEHWFRLGRSLTRTPNGRALVSWSASMFEYLMPLLVMRDWPGTLLNETYITVVERQISYGRERGIPWGVSESAFNAKDAELTYQYQAFGVPGLGLKRGLSSDIVVAPYAAMLALSLAPRSVTANLRMFSSEGAEGRYGMYEALDYTPGRAPAGDTRAVVKSYFAHHQGMGFVALVNALDNDRMQTRFHADPMVVSAELLLQERIPRGGVELVSPHVEEVREIKSIRDLPEPVARTYPLADTLVPATHFLSNGRYSVMVTNGGGGYSRWENLAVTRYREDVTRDVWGTFFYVRDVESGNVFSAPHNPYPTKPDDFLVTFATDKAEYRRVDGELETRIEVTVSPEDDVEIRRIAITNSGLTRRVLEVTSYFDIALTSQASDQAHKTFSNLFVETESVQQTNAVLFSRRPRHSEEERVWGLHMVACDQYPCNWSFETDRAAFLGRLRGAENPIAIERGGELGCGEGAVLDPCCAIRRAITIEPGETTRLVFVTGVAESRDQAIRLTEKYHATRSAQRAIDLAWTAAQLELRDLGISPEEAVVLDRLASRLLLTEPHTPLKVKTPAENGLQVSGLWSIGVSGDLPILLVRVEELEHAPLVRQALLAHQYWRHKGLVSDLVIINTRPSGYADELDDRLRLLVRTGHALQMLDKPGGVFLRRCDQMHPDVYNLLLSFARATLEGDAGSIELQLNRRGKHFEEQPGFFPRREPEPYPEPEFTRPLLRHDNGFGGFDLDTGDYVIVLEGEETTPAPWINVLANPTFGCTVSEAGVGCTWALNSHENRITTWNNDPISDGSGEAFYIRDEETGEFWSPTPLPVRTSEPYVVRYSAGRVEFQHETHGIAHQLDWFVSADDPVRVCKLTLENRSDRDRELSVTHLVEWVLGDSRSRAQQLVVTWFDAEEDVLTAHSHYNMDFPGRCAFVACDRPLHSWTASRTEFVGRNGRRRDPIAMHRTRLGGASGRFYDNCGALMTLVDLAPGQRVEVSFFLGQTATLEDCRTLIRRYRTPGTVDAAMTGSSAFWDDLLGTVQVETPDDCLDLLVNERLLYQATACRLWGRTATYQSSGAYGFRDQLQDVLSLLVARPDLVREQIVEASRHQFPEGDVQHWWQPYSGRGVRTHITDDRHWLPLVVAEYLETTGDTSVLDERTAFIEAPLLPLDQEDAYVQPSISEVVGTVYEHCIRALEAGRPTGVHGLPLMGGGDWNDGMNRVGHEGKGESVWLAWFLGHTLVRFAPICEARGEHELAEDYRQWAASLAQAAEEHAWDGAWYRRAYFDDGTPLGSSSSVECRIDAIAQAWATISGLGDPDRAQIALDSVDEKLVRREPGLIALLTPPFDRMLNDPGYIKGYVPGVRENGGQYTHAALWVVLGYLLQGDGDEAAGLLDLINPINHARDRESAERYKVEPYVVAADVYAVEPHTGRGGWTWYTGSASWFYRVALRWMLGFRIEAAPEGPRLVIDPCIPKRWREFKITYRHKTAIYHVHVQNPRGVNRGVGRVELDGSPLEELWVPLVDDGAEHQVVIAMLGG